MLLLLTAFLRALIALPAEEGFSDENENRSSHKQRNVDGNSFTPKNRMDGFSLKGKKYRSSFDSKARQPESISSDCRRYKTETILSIKGCAPRLVPNVLCAGFCPSVAYPSHGTIIRRCESCRAAEVIEKRVTVFCFKNSRAELRVASYKYVKNCICRKMTC